LEKLTHVSGIWERARILKESVRLEYIYTNKPRYDRDLKNTDVVVITSAFLYIISSKNLGTK
jgi:hypothetical protein